MFWFKSAWCPKEKHSCFQTSPHDGVGQKRPCFAEPHQETRQLIGEEWEDILSSSSLHNLTTEAQEEKASSSHSQLSYSPFYQQSQHLASAILYPVPEVPPEGWISNYFQRIKQHVARGLGGQKSFHFHHFLLSPALCYELSTWKGGIGRT